MPETLIVQDAHQTRLPTASQDVAPLEQLGEPIEHEAVVHHEGVGLAAQQEGQQRGARSLGSEDEEGRGNVVAAPGKRRSGYSRDSSVTTAGPVRRERSARCRL